MTLALTVDELSQLNPGISLTTPLENSITKFPVGGSVTTPQSFALGLGASGSAHATRAEKIAFTLSTRQLLADAKKQAAAHNGVVDCSSDQNGVMIESDLKIAQFIYDKISIEPEELTNGNLYGPPFNTFQDQLTFVAAFGGSVNPVWKFAQISIDPSSTLFSATRTKTNTLTITFGQYTKATPTSPAS